MGVERPRLISYYCSLHKCLEVGSEAASITPVTDATPPLDRSTEVLKIEESGRAVAELRSPASAGRAPRRTAICNSSRQGDRKAKNAATHRRPSGRHRPPGPEGVRSPGWPTRSQNTETSPSATSRLAADNTVLPIPTGPSTTSAPPWPCCHCRNRAIRSNSPSRSKKGASRSPVREITTHPTSLRPGTPCCPPFAGVRIRTPLASPGRKVKGGTKGVPRCDYRTRGSTMFSHQ
jgi:hypothetical protein